jgi:SAM-dependent methyltransferase
MKNSLSQFIKYPLYASSTLTWFEKLMVRTHFGGLARCCVCGSVSTIQVKEENLRETCICSKCSSTNRQRQIAIVACNRISSCMNRRISSLHEFASLDNFVVYNAEARGALHEQLSQIKNYLCSEYFGESYKSGDFVNTIMHQDLMALSLQDDSVDLVLSADVLEHIPNPYRAHEEIYRILKPGGRHIFTVPFYQEEFLDETRTVLDSSGNAVFLKDPQYHSDPIRSEGALVYTIFSLEMLVKLRKIGFRTNLYQLSKPLNGIWGRNAVVFEAIKE